MPRQPLRWIASAGATGRSGEARRVEWSLVGGFHLTEWWSGEQWRKYCWR